MFCMRFCHFIDFISFWCSHRLALDGKALYSVQTSIIQRRHVQTKLARYAMTWSVCTLLLTTVALMASQASVPAGPDLDQGRAGTLTLTRFVCAKCSETGQLSSRGLILSCAAVHRHIAASKPCPAAKMGILAIQVHVRTSDVMAGAGGAAGPAHDVRHQLEGTVLC